MAHPVSLCRSSSAVEYNLAKVGVAGSNPVFCSIIFAGVAELADAQDLKSCGERSPYRFDSGPRHHLFKIAPVAQLDRVLDYGSRGYGFDSYRARHFKINHHLNIREVAQLGRALGLGPRGRRFESCLPDSFKLYMGA